MRVYRFNGRRSGVPDLLPALPVPLSRTLKRHHVEDLRFDSSSTGPGKNVHSILRSKPALSAQANS
jgi:hypothetical protein